MTYRNERKNPSLQNLVRVEAANYIKAENW